MSFRTVIMGKEIGKGILIYPYYCGANRTVFGQDNKALNIFMLLILSYPICQLSHVINIGNNFGRQVNKILSNISIT